MRFWWFWFNSDSRKNGRHEARRRQAGSAAQLTAPADPRQTRTPRRGSAARSPTPHNHHITLIVWLFNCTIRWVLKFSPLHFIFPAFWGYFRLSCGWMVDWNSWILSAWHFPFLSDVQTKETGQRKHQKSCAMNFPFFWSVRGLWSCCVRDQPNWTETEHKNLPSVFATWELLSSMRKEKRKFPGWSSGSGLNTGTKTHFEGCHPTTVATIWRIDSQMGIPETWQVDSDGVHWELGTDPLMSFSYCSSSKSLA